MNVGCRAIDVVDAVQGARIVTHVLFPTRAAEQEVSFGPYPVSVAMDGSVAGSGLPLVVVSHGTGGSPWTYRDLAAFLARRGFVVALPEHPGNSRSDDRLAGTPANLENRPRHVRRVIDGVQGDPALGAHVAATVAVVGHSMGAYTALAVAGGRPSALPNETEDGRTRPVPVVRDVRVRALVLLAPATPWFMGEGALADVDVPILMRSGEKDAHAPSFHADIVTRGATRVPRMDARVVPGAGHFAFQTPFPAAMTRPEFPPSQDPPGFDRAAYLPTLYEEIATFLGQVAS